MDMQTLFSLEGQVALVTGGAYGIGFAIAEALAEAALADKKRSGDAITIVVPKEIGHCELMNIPVSELLFVIGTGWEA